MVVAIRILALESHRHILVALALFREGGVGTDLVKNVKARLADFGAARRRQVTFLHDIFLCGSKKEQMTGLDRFLPSPRTKRIYIDLRKRSGKVESVATHDDQLLSFDYDVLCKAFAMRIVSQVRRKTSSCHAETPTLSYVRPTEKPSQPVETD
jgi:hypothetical protein